MTLLAHYKLNGDVLDSSGNGFDGSPANITYTDGKLSLAASFNGTTSTIDCGDSATLALTIFTLSIWIKSTRIPSGGGKYWAIAGRGSIYDLGYGLEYYDRSTAAGFELWVRNSTASATVRTTGSYTITDWNHIVGVCNGSYLKIYVNGIYNNQIAQGDATPDTAGANNFIIGDDDNATSYAWQGAMDDVRVYDYALTDADIDRIYNEGRGTEESDLFTTTLKNCILKNCII